MTYNPWPLGHVPKHLQRVEVEQLKQAGYIFSDPREIVAMFEEKVSAFAGSPYAVSVDCCTHALELSIRYLIHMGKIIPGDTVIIPSQTYVSVPMMLEQLGFRVRYHPIKWSGRYDIHFTNSDYKVVDAAVRWMKGMYEPGTLYCLSFQIKKNIPIGRGGMVLTDDKSAAEWIGLASYDGRDLSLPYDHQQHVKQKGFHYYMTPEDCARGILLMDAITTECDSAGYMNYPNVKNMMK